MVSKLWRLPSPDNPSFSNGDAVICGDIAFFVDPADDLTLFAGASLQDYSDRQIALVAHESIRLLPELLRKIEDLEVEIRNRRLVVRIVDTYEGIWSDYCRAVQVIPAPLNDILPHPT